MVEVAAAAGHRVVAAARTKGSTSAGVTPVALDVRHAEAVRSAVVGADAVLWCVGVTRRSGAGVGRVGMSHVVSAAQELGVVRVVTVSGAGVTLPGDRKGLGARAASALTRRLASDLVTDKEAEHAVLVASGLAWTEVRPPRLVDVDASRDWVLTEQAPGLTAKPVSRLDVARAMVSLAGSSDWVQRSPFLVGR